MNKVPGYGPVDARIMVVGEAPGVDEDREGRPFVGRAGKAIRGYMMEVGIDPDEVYWTNIADERPSKNDIRTYFTTGKDGGQPLPIVIEGLYRLIDEIKLIKPNVILAVGNYPLWALTRKATWRLTKDTGVWSYSGIQDWRGSILPCVLPGVEGAKVIATFHPAYIIREGMKDHGTFKCDLQRALRESYFPEINYPKPELILDPEGYDREQVRQRLLDAPIDKPITLDIEYIGSKLLCIGMTNSRHWATSIWTGNEGDMRFCKEILQSGHPLNAQNAMFDFSILEWHYGFDIMRFMAWDTMLAAHSLNIELPKDQGYLTSIYTDQPYYKHMVDWKKIAKGETHPSIVLEYNCIDCWTEHQVMEEQGLEMREDEAARRVFEFEMALLNPLWQVSKRGMRIDETKLAAINVRLDKEIQINNLILHHVAGRPVNVKSGPDIAHLLFDVMGIPRGRQNKTGPATDDKTLADLVLKCRTDQQRSVIQLVRETRQKRDMKSKFTEVERDEDKRSRGMYNPGGTGTGRLASKKFYPTGKGHQQQNVPKDTEVRSLFIPDDGFEFGYADLERAESMVVAYLTNDPLMLAHHAPGMDAHRLLASLIFDVRPEQVTKDQRYIGKQTRHAGNYMEGPLVFKINVSKVAHLTGVSITAAEAKFFINRYRELHPFLVEWWADTEKELWRSRTLYNLMGRRRTFFDHIDSILPTAVAYKPQSTVGDVLNAGILNIAGTPCHYVRERCNVEEIRTLSCELNGLGFQILNQVHDAIGFQFRPENKTRILTILRKLMTIPLTSPKTYEDFSIPVEIAVGPSWGEVEVWKG
ncbi:MAG TPA: DNA polymerase [Candidatus Paceibacterota bacterium]